jgi:hypothetical protein
MLISRLIKINFSCALVVNEGAEVGFSYIRLGCVKDMTRCKDDNDSVLVGYN